MKDSMGRSMYALILSYALLIIVIIYLQLPHLLFLHLSLLSRARKIPLSLRVCVVATTVRGVCDVCTLRSAESTHLHANKWHE